MKIFRIARWKKPQTTRNLHKLANKMKRNPTKAEVRLEFLCRDMGLAVIPQHVKSGYILDIMLPQINVAIEADGSGHYTDNGMLRDMKRLARLRSEDSNFNILRYPNEKILTDKDFPSELARDIFKLSGFTEWPEWFKGPRT